MGREFIAKVAELADAPDSGSPPETLGQQKNSPIRDPRRTSTDENGPLRGNPGGNQKQWERALDAALEAAADDVAEALEHVPADAVERALHDALTRATAEGRYADAAELASALEARKRARAGVVDLEAERVRRGQR